MNFSLTRLTGFAIITDSLHRTLAPCFAGNPRVSHAWQNANIQDDPVLMSNIAGTIAYATAGPNTRTTQVYINLGDNSNLDSQGFAPFGFTDPAGMAVLSKVYAGYGQQPDQDLIYAQGDAYLNANFPLLSYTTDTSVGAATALDATAQ